MAFKRRGLILMDLNWDVRVGDMQRQFGTWEPSERLVENGGKTTVRVSFGYGEMHTD